MRTFTDHDLTVYAFDAKVWKQERNILRVIDTSSQSGEQLQLFKYTAASTTLIATYTVDFDGEVVIDMSEYIRVHANDSDRRVMVQNRVGNYVIVDFTVIGLINPANILIPQTASGMTIEPPSVMFRQLFAGLENAIKMESFTSVDTVIDMQAGVRFVRETIRANTPTAFRLNNMDSVKIGTYTISVKELEECRNYCAVRWVSFTGQTRLHVWEVVQRTTETAGAFELLTQDGSYDVVKGREDGFSLRLDGLNVYDYWYYSDICHSSNVDVTFDGQTWQRVNVTTKSVTLNEGDAGQLGTLLVELKYKKYDAVNM